MRSTLFPHASGQPGFVLAADIGVVWMVRPRAGPRYAFSLVTAILRTVPIVPSSWLLDVAEGTFSAVRAGQLAPEQVAVHFAVLADYPILVDHETPNRAWDEIHALARSLDVSPREAAYLELALRLGVPLATTDPNLTRAATASGVPLFTP